MKFSPVKTLFVCLAVGLSYASYGEGEKTMEAVKEAVQEGVQTTKTAIFDALDKESVTVAFEKDSAVVSESEKSTLRAVIQANRDENKIERVIVAAWSDSPLPASEKVKLSSEEKKLADLRAENIKMILQEFGVSKIETHSMAEHANWIEKMFRTKDSQIKDSMKGKTVRDAEDKELGEKLADKGGPGKAAVIIVSEKSGLSH